ncbi:hypothetical protein [Lysinibacillus sp. BW-2-10]|uniref:hypothetical protein n=1 Tax=Lysinibacillus sp. BW-2-10 TaxID=2590030 RepID=UPI00117F016A|nr:hypothetical protein [Lysinibacillus sp. BW-2-10]TSI05779.1 hypothetical protein FJQ64_11865 [Lysinibacillus sp. BW-2-10]
MLFEPLSQVERNELLFLVTDEQKEYLLNQVKRGRRTIFGNIMIEEKVQAIKSVDIDLQEDERNIEDWDIVDYVDFGPGNRLGKCACGITLRYMFTVQHKGTNKTITYGKDHLSAFLNLPIKDIDAVMAGLKTIDYELDELLVKIRDDDYGYEIVAEIPEEIELPKNIKEHVEHHIPLLNRQIKKIEREVNKYYTKELEKVKNEQREAERVEAAKRAQTYLKAREILRERNELEQKEKHARDQKILESTRHLLVSPNPTIAEIAYSLVLNGVSSANEISRITREYFHVDKRLSTGTLQRSYIYMDVVLALMNEAENGTLYFDKESSGIDDCYFYPSEEKLEINTTSTNNVQPSLF